MQSKQKQIFKSKKFWFVTISVIFALILGAGLVFGIFASSKSGSNPQLSLQTPIDEDLTTSLAWSGGTAAFTHGTGTENEARASGRPYP